jgi:hypothetical protein
MNGTPIEKLRKMLEQVDPARPGAAVRPILEARVSGQEATPTLDVVHATNTEAVEATAALQALDVLHRGGAIDSEKQFALEAIVMPLYRPVIDIKDDYIVTAQLTDTWNALGEASRRPWWTERILAVGRINVPGIQYAGTGFIVGPDLIMTNRHVAIFFAQGLGTRVDFHPGQTANIDFYQEEGGTKTESLTVKKVVMIHPWWDMALLKVSGLPSNRRPLSLSVADPTSFRGRRVVVIGYPGYDSFGDLSYQAVQSRIFRNTYYVKRFQPGLFRVRENATSFGREVSVGTHDCSTLGGNSGSAVIDVESGQVVGLHFAGTYLVANYAVSPFDLAQDSRVVDAGVNFAGRLDPRGDFYGPIWKAADSAPSGKVGAEAANLPSRPQAASAACSATTATVPLSTTCNPVTVVIPLQLSLSLGTPTLSTASAPAHVPLPSPGPAMVPPSEGLFRRAAPAVPTVPLERFSLDSLRASGFDWRTALSLALASNLAYATPDAIREAAMSKWGFASCQVIDADDTRCFVAAASEAVLVSFRGTNNVGNWLSNLNVLYTTRNYGTVHRGFLGALQVVEPQLRSALANLNERKLLLTGHSLGGALATIAAAEWQEQLPISWMYTYGQPAVGKSNFQNFFAQHYAGNLFRFVNNDDIVPRVPPTYRHVGTLYHFDARGNLESLVEAAAREIAKEATGAVFDSPDQPRMLTEMEFDHMRAQLLEHQAMARASGQESLEAPVVEGVLPSLHDHHMEQYLAKIVAKVS